MPDRSSIMYQQCIPILYHHFSNVWWLCPILYHHVSLFLWFFPFYTTMFSIFHEEIQVMVLSSPDGQEVGIAINQFLLQDGQVNQFLHLLGPRGSPWVVEKSVFYLFREIDGNNNYEVI